MSRPWLDVRDFAPLGTPRDFNNPATDSIDWQPYLQAAIDYILAQPYNSDVATLHIPPGVYKLGRPLFIGKVYDDPVARQQRYTHCTIQIVGDAPGFGMGATPASVLYTRYYADRPAIIIEGARAVKLKNLVIQGLNDWTSMSDRDPVKAATHYHDKSYLAPGISDNLRYAPYAAIAIDPFGQGLPPPPAQNPDNIPDGGYPGMSAYYHSGLGSSMILIEDCTIDAFVVGIAISTSLNTQGPQAGRPVQNGENILISNCLIRSTKTAIATGQDQGRNITAHNLLVHGTKYVINTLDYGIGAGNCPAISGANVSGSKQLFKVSSRGATPSISGLRCESTLMLGQFEGGAQNDGFVFSSCHFNFNNTPVGPLDVNNMPSPNFRLANGSTMIFSGCTFLVGELTLGEPIKIINSGKLSFQSCVFAGRFDDALDHAPLLWIDGVLEGVSFNSCFMNSAFGDAAQLSGDLRLSDMDTFHSFLVVPGVTLHQSFAQELSKSISLRWVSGGMFELYIGPTQVTVMPDGTATFPLPPGGAGFLRKSDLVFSADPLYYVFEPPTPNGKYQLVIGKIHDISSDTVTLKFVPQAVMDQGSQLMKLYLRNFPRLHAPAIGFIDADDPTKVTGVVSGGDWNIGDRISADVTSSSPASTTRVTAPGTYVVSYTKGTITLSRPATVKGATARLYGADVRQIDMTQRV